MQIHVHVYTRTCMYVHYLSIILGSTNSTCTCQTSSLGGKVLWSLCIPMYSLVLIPGLCLFCTCMYVHLDWALLCVYMYIQYRILPKISPLPSLTSKFLHRYFYLVYKPPSLCYKKCTVSKNERVAIDKNAVICSLDCLTSWFVGYFC